MQQTSRATVLDAAKTILSTKKGITKDDGQRV